MISDRQVMAIFKFGEYQYMQQLKDGHISFSCPGSYIEIARKSGNEDQGDFYEGVFAKLKNGDKKIDEMRHLLGDDLEILDNGEYVMLRRFSSYLVPTFCFYSYKVSNVLEKDITDVGWQYIRHNFHETMYTGFGNYAIRNVLSNQKRPATLLIQPKPFEENLKLNLKLLGVESEIRHINYTEFEKDEFFIEPTDRRDELFYKFPRYSNQLETRICLLNKRLNKVSERMNIHITPLNNNDSFMFHEEVYFETNVNIGKE